MHSLNEKGLEEQKGKEIAQMKRLYSPLGDICRWVYAKIWTESRARSAEVMEGMGCGSESFPQTLLSSVSRGKRTGGDVICCGRGQGTSRDKELRATDRERV